MLEAVLWMIGLTLVLFWLPVIGPGIAGVVGGLKAGTTGRGIVASLIPAALAAILVILVATLFAVPWLGALLGAGIFIVIIFESAPLLVGAALGGFFAERRRI